MTFSNMNYLIPAIIFLGGFFYLYLRNRSNFFTWVEDHWFYKQSRLNKISTYFYMAGMIFIISAMLDLRGPEKRVKGAAQDTKTIILIDSSASMLAEDVRPNRFKKALLLVKHYVKKAVGQQISLVVFSDSQKRIIPFTDDIDLIYARVERLESLNLGRGGTGLTQAIAESVEYFKSSGGELSGNILIFTDAEETELEFPLDIPKSITVGMIGIGTAKGAPIPVRDSRGEFKGNKKFQGKVVISKLSENVLKELSNKIKNYQYWIATSYSLPTEEILAFFNRVDKAKNLDNEFRVKPVLANYLLIPGAILLFFAFMFNYRRSFSLGLLIFALQLQMSSAFGQGAPKEEKAPEKSELSLKLESLLAQNQLDDAGRRKLAESLLKDGFPKLSETLYEEVLPKKFTEENLKDFSNYALSKIKNGKKSEGLEDSKRMLEYLDHNKVEQSSEVKKALEKNILKAIAEGGGSGKGSGESDDKNEKGDNKEKSDSKDSKSGDQDKNEDDEKENNDKKNKSDKKDKGSEKESDQKNKSEDESKGENKKIPKKKLPAILKQLISDDNKLQKKIIDAKTTERKTREQKDW